jgi:hypothetical protein
MIYKKPYLESLGKKPFLTEKVPEPYLEFDKPDEILIPDGLRPQGLYIAGNPGYGKSSLIQNLVLSDIEAGYGVCVIDPSGDLIRPTGSQNGIIDWIPEHRVGDVIYFNTSDHARSIEFFSYRDPEERRVLLDELVALFKLENAPRAKPYLTKIISILFDANDNKDTPPEKKCTFLDIQTFIEDKTRRDKILGDAKQQWANFPKPSEFEAITSRFIQFTNDAVLRKVFASPNPEINLWDVMQENKILLVDLSTAETDKFIASLIVAGLQQATFRRRIIPREKRKLFFLYIDEFHFIVPGSGDYFGDMLTRARKYGLCLTLANPYPDDLPSEIQRKLPGIDTKILFRLDESNALPFRHQLKIYSHEQRRDLPVSTSGLPKFSAIVLTADGKPTVVQTPSFLSPNPASSAESILNRIDAPEPTPVSEDRRDGIDYDTIPPRESDTP